MFKEEKTTIVDLKDRTIKLEDKDGRIVSLIFIKDDKLIIRGEFFAKDSSIEAPKINSL